MLNHGFQDEGHHMIKMIDTETSKVRPQIAQA